MLGQPGDTGSFLYQGLQYLGRGTLGNDIKVRVVHTETNEAITEPAKKSLRRIREHRNIAGSRVV